MEAVQRPRVEGAREREIHEATLAILVESGYDRLTLDAVAARAKASKATLYRRWAGKAELVCDAVAALHHTQFELPDTGSLREDLIALTERKHLLDPAEGQVLCGVATAVARDTDLAALFRQRMLLPEQSPMRDLLLRARDRGQLRPDADLDLLCEVLPALVVHHLSFVSPDVPLGDFVVRVIDQVFLPAATGAVPDPTRS